MLVTMVGLHTIQYLDGSPCSLREVAYVNAPVKIYQHLLRIEMYVSAIFMTCFISAKDNQLLVQTNIPLYL